MIAIIAAGTSGIGQSLIQQLLVRNSAIRIYASYNDTDPVQSLRNDSRVSWTKADLSQEADIAAWLKTVEPPNWLINCAGILHTQTSGPEKTIRDLDPAFFSLNMQINCLPTLLLAKHTTPLWRSAKIDSGTRIFATVSAKVGSIEDNRLGGWYSYRASKAALNMCLKNLSIEWRRQLPEVCVASLHPGTTDTALSRPFQKNVPENSLFDSEFTANKLLDVLESKTPEQSGRFWSWDGTELPW